MNEELALLRSQVKELQQENKRLKAQIDLSISRNTVIVPEEFKVIFEEAEQKVAEYFTEIYNSAESGEIVIHGQVLWFHMFQIPLVKKMQSRSMKKWACMNQYKNYQRDPFILLSQVGQMWKFFRIAILHQTMIFY